MVIVALLVDKTRSPTGIAHRETRCAEAMKKYRKPGSRMHCWRATITLSFRCSWHYLHHNMAGTVMDIVGRRRGWDTRRVYHAECSATRLEAKNHAGQNR